MEISANGLNQPVSFYQKNTGNTINMAIDEDVRSYQTNIFAPEHASIASNITENARPKGKRKNKKLNATDSEFFAVSETENPAIKEEGTENFFIISDNPFKRFKNRLISLISSIPVLNYFILKKRTQKLQNTVSQLADIKDNVNEMINAVVAKGEEEELYSDIAKNLTAAANIIDKANKDI